MLNFCGIHYSKEMLIFCPFCYVILIYSFYFHFTMQKQLLPWFQKFYWYNVYRFQWLLVLLELLALPNIKNGAHC